MFVTLFLAIGLWRGWHGYQYIFHNSENSLPAIYKLSAFWSGDAGSLILWLAMVSVLVFACMRLGDRYRLAGVSAYVLQAFIVVLTLLADPFRAVSPIPADGMGLSVLLQNPWMVTHPPVVFASYALLAVPFGMTVQYLLKPSPQTQADWRKSVQPWLLASWLLLGLGILLGALWAYETLGWGGYWGWDPVENSSLVPWLLLTVAVHSIVIDEGTNSGVRASAASIAASFCSMVAAVFITRSGALSELSVHTFAGSDWAFWVILAGFAVALGFSVLALTRGWRLLPNPDQADWTAKPFTIGIGNIAITVFALAILAGTLLPMLGGKSLTRIYYQTIMVPVSAIMLIGAGVAPFQAWKATGLKQLVRNLILPLFICAGLLLAFPHNGDWVMTTIGAFACLAAGANIVAMTKVSARRWGSYLSHIGLGLMAAGILVSSMVQDSKTLTMTKGVEADFFGFTTKIASFSENEDGSQFASKYSMVYEDQAIEGIVKGRWDRKSSEWVMEPSINRSFSRDVIFIVSSMSEGLIFDLREAKVSERNGYRIEALSSDESETMLKVGDGSKEYEVKAVNLDAREIEKDFLVLDRGDGTFYLRDFRDGRPGTAKFSVTVSIRYWTFFLWLGGLILLAGILWAFAFRVIKPRKLAPIGTVKVEAIKA
jgi:cytochrome c-type biogenesis protein CcmF